MQETAFLTYRWVAAVPLAPLVSLMLPLVALVPVAASVVVVATVLGASSQTLS